MVEKGYYPATVDEALHLLRDTGGIPLAGGTDLMVRHHRSAGVPAGFDQPPVYVGGIPELLEVRSGQEGLSIGAAATLSDILKQDNLPPGLAEALRLIGSPAIRNSATVAGNICNASPAADSLPVLYCLDASVEVATAEGRTLHPIQDFITGPGTTVLQPGELVTRIVIPPWPDFRVFYKKIGTRRANALSKLSFLGLYRLQSGALADVRIAVGAASPRVLRIPEAEKSLIGLTPKEASADAGRVLSFYEGHLAPINDQRSTADYRKRTALRLLEHFLTKEIG